MLLQVSNIVSRQQRGKETYYEVEWENLPDPKQNTWEPLSKLRKMAAEGHAKARAADVFLPHRACVVSGPRRSAEVLPIFGSRCNWESK